MRNAGAGGLDHLVDGPVAAGKEPLREEHGSLIDDVALLIGEQLVPEIAYQTVITVGRGKVVYGPTMVE